MRDTGQQLDEAIDLFYQAFSEIRAPRTIEFCSCCMTRAELLPLVSKPLQEIEPEELGRYAAKAMTTVGSEGDYLYFLPRIMEVSIIDRRWWPDIEVTGKKIKSTNVPTWPSNRLDALDTLLDAVISRIISTPSWWELDKWLCAIGQMGLNLDRWLKRVEAEPDAVLEYFQENELTIRNNKLSNAFWELPNEGHDTIVAWIKSVPIRKIIFDAYGYLI